MNEQFQKAFDDLQAPQQLKRAARAHIRRKTFDYGRQTFQHRQHRRRIAACLLSLVLVLSGTGIWFLPATSIGLDINPSLELTVNALDRVIALKGKNDDGLEVAKHLDVSGMPYDEAMQRILISEELEPYLEAGSMISISVVGGGSDVHAEKILSRVVCRAYAIAEDENVFYCQTDKETLEAARESGLCIPRYLAWQHLLEQDPDVTAEAVAQMPKDEIRALAQLEIIENPCGE
jgi:hypothetical protein